MDLAAPYVHEIVIPGIPKLTDKILHSYRMGLESGVAYPSVFAISMKRLINWPFNNFYNDLGYLCVTTNMSPDQEKIFLEAYLGRPPEKSDLEILLNGKCNFYLSVAATCFYFSENEEDKKLPLKERVDQLDSQLRSRKLKPSEEYLREGILLTLQDTSKEDFKQIALSFYKAFLKLRTRSPYRVPVSIVDSTMEVLLALKPKSEGFLPTSFRKSLEINLPPQDECYTKDIYVKLAEERYNHFCERFLTGSAHTLEPSIPHLIHLIWLGSPPTRRVNLAVESWKKYHPDWDIKLWTDQEIENFSWSTPHSQSFFEKSISWAEKSDILRCELLYQYGGIYSDIDAVCLNSFEDLVSNGLTFFACYEGNCIAEFVNPRIGTAILGAAKNSSVMKRSMDYSIPSDEAGDLILCERSGPGPVTKACNETLLFQGEENILILPSSYFYPMPWVARSATVNKFIEFIQPETLAIHLWEGTWFGSDVND